MSDSQKTISPSPSGSPNTVNKPRSRLRLTDSAEQLCWLESRHGVRQWHRWTVTHPALLDWSPAELISPTTSTRTDAMQAALVAVAQGGEGRAAVLLLTQLAPGLHRICRWAASAGYWPWHEAVPEVRAVFYETLYRHSLERRPVKIAANLVLDTRQRIQRTGRRLRPVDIPGFGPCGRSMFDGDPASELTDHLAARSTVSAAIAEMPGSQESRQLTADLAYRVWFLDQPRSAVAAEFGLADGAVNVRLHRLRSIIDREQLRC